MADPQAFAVNPEEAIAYFRQKLNLPTSAWTDLWQGMHARAFVVAGATKEALLADFRQAVDKALAEGKSRAWFRQEFDRIVAAHGWSYRGSAGWRSAVIFNTNLRMAYAAGRWAQIVRLADRRPWLRYVAVMDRRTRKLHAAWHDTVLRWDDGWWRTHFPPNGWNCRCTIQQLSDRDLARLGLRPAAAPPPSRLVARRVSSAAGQKTVLVPEGIDPGFAYNPGEAGFGRGPGLLAAERHGTWQGLEPLFGQGPLPKLPADLPARPPLDKEVSGETALRDVLRQAIGGDEAVLSDPSGAPIAIGQAAIDRWLQEPDRLGERSRWLPLLPELIEDPAEIWVGFVIDPASGRVGLRRRYVKLVDLGGGRMLGLAMDADGRRWSGLTFFVANRAAADALRQGLLVYRRP